MSKRQLKLVEKDLLREEKLKDSMSYVEAPQKDHKVDEMSVDMNMPQVSEQNEIDDDVDANENEYLYDQNYDMDQNTKTPN